MQAIDLIVRSVPILIGGGAVQLAIYFLKRRSELRALDAATSKIDAESGSVVVSSAERSVALADAGRDFAIQEARSLREDLAVQVLEVRRLTARLAVVEQEVRELRAAMTRPKLD